jgi:methanogenic corrinoid protein MtbC1
MTDVSQTYSQNYLQFVLQGNRSKCSSIVHSYLERNNSIYDLYEQVIKVALYRVGELWEQNKITVATEHLATAITEGILNELFEQIISSDRLEKKVVLTCVDKEQHQVGIKMVADVFEMHGWESYFLGTGIPLGELVKYIEEVRPDILAISLSVYFNFKKLIETLDFVRARFPDLFIIIGGQAFKQVPDSQFKKLDKVIYFPDLYILEQFVKSIK